MTKQLTLYCNIDSDEECCLTVVMRDFEGFQMHMEENVGLKGNTLANIFMCYSTYIYYAAQ